jgi:hypothetical protein
MEMTTPNKELQLEVERFIDDIKRALARRDRLDKYASFEDILVVFYGDVINAGEEALVKLRNKE